MTSGHDPTEARGARCTIATKIKLCQLMTRTNSKTPDQRTAEREALLATLDPALTFTWSGN
jgi:hypothetical protein